MKKQPLHLAYFRLVEEFSLTALSCPSGPKLKIHVENWTEEHSVISTLWIQDVSKFQNSDLLLKEPRFGPKLDMDQLSEASYERSLIYGLSDQTKYVHRLKIHYLFLMLF